MWRVVLVGLVVVSCACSSSSKATSGHNLSGARPNDRPVMIERAAQACGSDPSDVKFEWYAPHQTHADGSVSGLMNLTITNVAINQGAMIVDENGIVVCPDQSRHRIAVTP